MAKAAPTVALRPSAASRTLSRPTGFKPISVSVGLNGRAIRLLVPDEIADGIFVRTEQPGWASFPKTHTQEDYSPIVVVSDPAGSEEIRLSGLTATFPQIEMLPSNEVLVVATRCQRFPDGTHELNAKVYDSSGALKREFLLGDGINHVQADAHGRKLAVLLERRACHVAPTAARSCGTSTLQRDSTTSLTVMRSTLPGTACGPTTIPVFPLPESTRTGKCVVGRTNRRVDIRLPLGNKQYCCMGATMMSTPRANFSRLLTKALNS